MEEMNKTNEEVKTEEQQEENVIEGHYVPHIKIKSDGVFTQVYIDGRKVKGIRKVSFVRDINDMREVATVDISLSAEDLDIDGRFIPALPELYRPYYGYIGSGTNVKSEDAGNVDQ